MDTNHMVQVVDEQIAISRELLFKKNNSYNPNADRLMNFRKAATLEESDIFKALAGMMAKHTVSLYDMCFSEDRTFEMEDWEEKITDHINYLLLLKMVVVEENDKRSATEEQLSLDLSMETHTHGKHNVGFPLSV